MRERLFEDRGRCPICERLTGGDFKHMCEKMDVHKELEKMLNDLVFVEGEFDRVRTEQYWTDPNEVLFDIAKKIANSQSRLRAIMEYMTDPDHN